MSHVKQVTRTSAVGLRLKAATRDWIDSLATEQSTTFSDVVRASLTVARRHEDEVRKLLKEQS